VAKYLILWRRNDLAPWSTDPKEKLEFAEKLWLSIDILMKRGLIKDHGSFLDGEAGYSIAEGESADVFRHVRSIRPYFGVEVKEIISCEKIREIVRPLYKKAIAEAAKK